MRAGWNLLVHEAAIWRLLTADKVGAAPSSGCFQSCLSQAHRMWT